MNAGNKYIYILTAVVLLVGGAAYGTASGCSSDSTVKDKDGKEFVSMVHAAIILDQSDSMIEDTYFSILAGLVHRALDVPGAGKKSKLYVFTTGDASTAWEPVHVATIPIPASHRLLEGPTGGVKDRESAVAEVVLAWREHHKVVRGSAIYRAVARAVAQLRAAGCHPDTETPCLLLLRTDGYETVDKWIRTSLRRGEFATKGQPPSIDARGFVTVFCGLAEVKGKAGKRLARKKDGTLVDNTSGVWSKMFPDGSRVEFEPFCPRAGR